jgi:hypothetical protein
MKRKMIMRIMISAVIIFTLLKWTGIIKVQIPEKLFFVIIIIGALELCGFIFIGIKLYKKKSKARKTTASDR